VVILMVCRATIPVTEVPGVALLTAARILNLEMGTGNNVWASRGLCVPQE
jgi:hypothetical protein